MASLPLSLCEWAKEGQRGGDRAQDDPGPRVLAAPPRPPPVGEPAPPGFADRKRRLGKAKRPAQGHAACRWRGCRGHPSVPSVPSGVTGAQGGSRTGPRPRPQRPPLPHRRSAGFLLHRWAGLGGKKPRGAGREAWALSIPEGPGGQGQGALPATAPLWCRGALIRC